MSDAPPQVQSQALMSEAPPQVQSRQTLISDAPPLQALPFIGDRSQHSPPQVQSQAFVSDAPLLQVLPCIGDRDLSSQSEDSRTGASSSASAQLEDSCNHRTWGSSGASKKFRRGRGPSTGLSLYRHVHLFGKIDVEISPETMRPTDSVVATKLPRECTRIVRIHAPLKNKKSWKDVKDSEKQPLYAHLQKSFNIKDMDAPHVRQCIEEYFANTYNRFRNYCHTHYLRIKDSGTDPRQHSYRDVRQEDWEFLCDHFESESFKKRSITNKSNRGKLEFSHCMGPKSFIMALNEKEKMMEIQKKVQEEESPMTQDEIYNEVMGGKYWYLKLAAQRSKAAKQKRNNIALWKETQELRQKLAVQDEFIKSLQKEKEEQAKRLEDMRTSEAKLEEQAKQLEEMRAHQVQLEASFRQIMQRVTYGDRS
ncbi:hypothetical protein ACLOJK_031786 [Asimina triloba]